VCTSACGPCRCGGAVNLNGQVRIHIPQQWPRNGRRSISSLGKFQNNCSATVEIDVRCFIRNSFCNLCATTNSSTHSHTLTWILCQSEMFFSPQKRKYEELKLGVSCHNSIYKECSKSLLLIITTIIDYNMWVFD